MRFGGFALYTRPFLPLIKGTDTLGFLLAGGVAGGDLLARPSVSQN